MKINGEEITFSAPCDAGLSGQEKYNTIVDANINEIIAAIEARMN
jgi:hypothetical protein